MKLGRKSLVGGVLAGVMVLGAPAFASSVLSVDGATAPAGNISISGALSSLTASFLTDADLPATCRTGTVDGYVTRGSTITGGARIGAVTDLMLDSCTQTSLLWKIAIRKDPSYPEWGIYAASTPTAGQTVIPVELRGVRLYWTSPGTLPWVCELGLAGSVKGAFNQSTQELSITPATTTSFPLASQAFDGAGTKTPAAGTCAGQIFTGDAFQMTGRFALSTPASGGIHW